MNTKKLRIWLYRQTQVPQKLTGRFLKKAKVCGEVDFPNKEHQPGSFLRILLVMGVVLSTSVLSFRRVLWSFSLLTPSSSTTFSDVSLASLLLQYRVRSNNVGEFFPPENAIVYQPSMLPFSPTGISSSEFLVSDNENGRC